MAAMTLKYFDLKKEVSSARTDSMASKLGAASAANFAAALLGSDQILPVEECRDAAGLLQSITGYDSGEHPFIHEYQGHHITDIECGQNQVDASSLCKLTDNQGNSSEFQVYHTFID